MGTWGWLGVGGLVAAVVLAATVGCGSRRGGSRKRGAKGRSRSSTTKFVVSKDKKLDTMRRTGIVYMREASRLQLLLAKFIAQNKRKESKSIAGQLARLEEKMIKLRLKGVAMAA